MSSSVPQRPAETLAPGSTAAATVGPPRIGGAVWAALGIVYVVWGSTYLAIRVVVETMPPLLSASARFSAAAPLLALLLVWRQGVGALRVTRRQLGSAVLVGLLLLVGGNGLVVLAERSVPSGMAALLVASVPLWVVVLNLAGGRRPAVATLAGVLLGLAGLVVLTSPGLSGQVRLGGLLSVVLGALIWAFGSFLAGRLEMPANAMAASVYEMAAAGLGAGLLAVVRHEPQHFDPAAVSGRSWAALAYLVVFGSLIAFTAYAWLLQRAPLSLVATYAYVNPVVAVLLGWLVLAEPLTWPVLLGGAIVVSGVFLVVRAER
ncbi:EamA family transporter [Kitasatospora sp. MBT63]|uniref:EamA family transporter n=1 Tax=Kitasatospora sp. MBT63 TaxID=1444768 RepID=UPI0009EA8B33|nr:EamA family transporter [Kitasatospora sp. MBT63]